MLHVVREQPQFLKIGTLICYEHPFTGQSAEGRVVGRETGVLRVRLIGSNYQEVLVPFDSYRHSLAISPNLERRLPVLREIVRKRFPQDYQARDRELALLATIETWLLCEKEYKIDEHGSDTKDQLRRLAFLILAGDPISLDMGRDVLRI